MVDPDNTEVVPVVENGRTLVPVRFISEQFGAEVIWIPEEPDWVTIKTEEILIQMTIGYESMAVNGELIDLDVAPKVVSGRTLLPLRAIVEALEKEVSWDDGLIIIGDQKYDAGVHSIWFAELKTALAPAIPEPSQPQRLKLK